MSLEIEFATPAQASSLSGGIPSYQTPRPPSRPPPRHAVSSPMISSLPSPGPSTEDSYSRVQDTANDEKISLLDPRRFTPNLHASLVSEILSLRREIESKNTVVETLEESLHDTKTENGQLNETSRTQVEEVRSLKRQMHLLETGTLSALGELAKERDGAVENLSDTQKRLEASKIKARAHEEEVERTHGLWDRDRQVWDDEKRNMERKVHVVEGRLKTILNEVAAAQANASQQATASNEIDHGMRETWFTKSSDSSTSNRSSIFKGRSRLSGLSNNPQDGSDGPNFRVSTSSGPNGFGATRLNGLTLAEELEFDEDGDNLEDFDTDGGLASPDALPEEAQMRRRRSLSLSQLHDQKARKVLGLLAESNERLMQGDLTGAQPMEKIEEKSDRSIKEPAVHYTDNGTQFSPPLSPKSRVQDTDAPAERNTEQTEHTANQRRKRVSIQSTSLDQTPSMKPGASLNLQMVSAGCQTLEIIGPPLMPKNHTMSSATASLLANGSPETKSSTTQTYDEDILMLMSVDTRNDSLMTIPTIAIHPPGSRPPSSHTGVVLPPRTKNAASQVSIELPISVRSVSVQTEDVRPDKRPLKIPPRLISTHTPSKPYWRHEEVKEPIRNQVAPRKSSRRNPHRPPAEPTLPRARVPIRDSIDSYPGNNDNGPLNKKQSSDLRRPIRDQSLFAGFESASDGEVPAIPDIAFSDDDFATAPPVRKTLSKVQNSWKLVPHSKSVDLESLRSDQIEEDINKENEPENVTPRPEPVVGRKQPPLKSTTIKSSAKPPNSYHAAREPNIRRTALISSGAAAHTKRARSPSAPSAARDPGSVAPPFPVPTRSSSRRIPVSASEGARSPTPYSTNFFSASRTQELGRPPSKNAVLRKVRSATATSKFGPNHPRRSRSRSPPSTSLFAPESPRLPPLSQHDIPSRPVVNDQKYKDLSSASSLTPPVTEGPTESLHQSTSVVDAIAQTMVGEWMWKYVRRRKSFGISESPQVEFDVGRNNGENGVGSGIRHKRWVWLAPYERAIMWSSKQPTSGSALLGKNGRKRKWYSTCLTTWPKLDLVVIQAVLDVKDDTPMPKNSDSQSLFNRSILILTPQRALKFTAITTERHYIWLSALSFLSQSSSRMNDLANIPSAPRQEYPPPSRASNGSRRSPILDSFRTANFKRRHFLEGNRAHTSPLGIPHAPSAQEGGTTYDEDDMILDAAEAPHVPRMSSHQRKRSSTGPRSGPPSISHMFVNKATMSSSNVSLQASLSHDGFPPFQRGNPRISEANTGSSHVIRNNFFDAVGTVRMEAFIDEGEKQAPQRRKESKTHRTRQGRKKDLSYWGVGGSIGQDLRLQQGNESRWKGDDPFKGF